MFESNRLTVRSKDTNRPLSSNHKKVYVLILSEIKSIKVNIEKVIFLL